MAKFNPSGYFLAEINPPAYFLGKGQSSWLLPGRSILPTTFRQKLIILATSWQKINSLGYFLIKINPPGYFLGKGRSSWLLPGNDHSSRLLPGKDQFFWQFPCRRAIFPATSILLVTSWQRSIFRATSSQSSWLLPGRRAIFPANS